VYGQKRIRVRVEDIIHPFIKKRPGQTRGYTAMAAAMTRLNMIGGMDEAELVAVRAAAQKMGFIESSVPESMFDQYYKEDGIGMMDSGPGQIEELPVGKKFTPWDPTHPTSVYPDFHKNQLRGAAAGLGRSYTSISNNIEDVNFSSIRAGLLEERESYKSEQVHFTDEVMQEIFEAWLECGLLSGAIALPYSRYSDFVDEDAVIWKPRRWPWVDPRADVEAALTAVAGGIETRSNVVADKGADLEDVLEELDYEEKLIKKLGISVQNGSSANAPIIGAAEKQAQQPQQNPPKKD
jgi:lambda family phage portal protein